MTFDPNLFDQTLARWGSKFNAMLSYSQLQSLGRIAQRVIIDLDTRAKHSLSAHHQVACTLDRKRFGAGFAATNNGATPVFTAPAALGFGPTLWVAVPLDTIGP